MFVFGIRTLSSGSLSREELLDPPGIASLSAVMSPRFFMRQGPRFATESDSASWARTEPRRDVFAVYHGMNALGFDRRKSGNSGARHDGDMSIAPQRRAAGTQMVESDG